MQKIFNLTNLTLIVALALSAVAAYYSIIGLTAIFAGAVIPVIVMGTILEIGKITTTVWLRKYWSDCGFLLKTYLVSAVILIAFLTSMGIFGFLSKAHMDSGLVSGDVQSRLELIDERIKVQRENIDTARRALAQLDAQVNERLSRGNTEQGVERAATLRRQQQQERNKLLKDVNDAQAVIQKLNEERAPIAAESRKVEAEIGPIKYVAALLYGDDPDMNLLERAVRWVIILLVIVFDPLAIALVLASHMSRDVDKKIRERNKPKTETEVEHEVAKTVNIPQAEQVKENSQVPEQTKVEIKESEKEEEKKNSTDLTKYSKNLLNLKPQTITISPEAESRPTVVKQEVATLIIEETKQEVQPVVDVVEAKIEFYETDVEESLYKDETPEQRALRLQNETPRERQLRLQTENITKENPITLLEGEYLLLEGKHMRKGAAEELRPDLFKITADKVNGNITSFGQSFPKVSNKGDFFVRIDFNPHRVFKFDGKRWIEINKKLSQTYLFNSQYIQYLISKIDSGEIEIDSLSEQEQEQVQSYLQNNK